MLGWNECFGTYLSTRAYFRLRWISSPANSGTKTNISWQGYRAKACTIREWLPDQATLIVLSSIPWSDYLVSGVRGHNTHWRLLVFSIKYGQSNAQFTRGSWSWRLYSRNGLRTWGRVLLSSKKEWICFGMSIDSIDFDRLLLVLCA